MTKNESVFFEIKWETIFKYHFLKKDYFLATNLKSKAFWESVTIRFYD